MKHQVETFAMYACIFVDAGKCYFKIVLAFQSDFLTFSVLECNERNYDVITLSYQMMASEFNDNSFFQLFHKIMICCIGANPKKLPNSYQILKLK